MIGARLDVPVIPVGISGSTRFSPDLEDGQAGPGPIRFGAPWVQGDDYGALAKQVEDAGGIWYSDGLERVCLSKDD